ncbi:hypothetical protein MTO96_023612 [Rhipicephalus appendiculatus]
MGSLVKCSVVAVAFAIVFAETWAAPNPEKGWTPTDGSSSGLSRLLDLGAGIADKFGLSLNKGIGGTKLGIDGPSNFRLQLDKKTPFNVLHSVYSHLKETSIP